MTTEKRVASELLVLALALSSLPGCARARAKTAPDNPALEAPAPPPRDVEPTDTEPPPPVGLPQEPARSTPARPRPTPPRETRPEAPRQEAPKPEPPPAAAPEPPKPAEEAPKPPSTLQTTPAVEEVELERGVRATISRATADLSRVDYRRLNADARSQYDYAKRFIRQAEEAVKAKNLVFAKTLADKAATVAAQLAGR